MMFAPKTPVNRIWRQPNISQLLQFYADI